MLNLTKMPRELLNTLREMLSDSGDAQDKSGDEKIARLTPMEAVETWSKYHTGTEYWGRKAVEYFNVLS